MLLADRIALMRDGEILQVDAPHEIYAHPVDPFAVEFFGEVNRVDGVVAGTWVETRLGRIANRTLPSGTPVEVLIRPEALRIGEDNGFAEGPAKVYRIQFAGGSSLVQLGFDQDRTHMQAKFPGHHKMTIASVCTSISTSVRPSSFPKTPEVQRFSAKGIEIALRG